MKRMLISVLLGAILLIPGCGASGDVAAPEEEEVIEETDIEEDVEEPAQEAVEEEPATEEEPEIEEVIEESPATEEEEEEEPAEEVKVPKAEFKGSNLTIECNADSGNTTYSITVDVQNVGNLAGEYKFTPRLDTRYLEEIKVSLKPGEKKTITLTEAQVLVGNLLKSYNTGTTSKREYFLTAAGCREEFEFPFAEDVLQLISTYGVKYADGYIDLIGRVVNISDKILENVEIVVRNYAEDGKFINEESTLIAYHTLEIGKESSFHIVYYSPDTKKYSVYFRYQNGDRIRTDYGEYEVYRPPEK